MEPMGDKKPSQLLAAMLEICPRDEHGSKLFAALFLQRLPRELRVVLAHDDHTNLRQLAAKADQLQAFHKQQAHDVAAISPADAAETVAAIKQPGKGDKKQWRKGGSAPPVPPRSKAAPYPPDASVCFYHWTYGVNAQRCKAPCSWQSQGNC